jgi:DNA integrity scanning protein DisA with diadenylate cyclase activity
VAVYRWFYAKIDQNPNSIITYANDDVTPNTTQTYSDNGQGTRHRGRAQ